MKHLVSLVILSLVMTITSLTSSAAERQFAQIAKLKGVESVYIGPAAMRFAGDSHFSPYHLGVFNEGIKEIRTAETIECEKQASRDSYAKIQECVNDLISRLNLELIMETYDSEDGEAVRIFSARSAQPDTDGSTPGYLLIENNDSEDYTVVFVEVVFKSDR